MSAYVTLPNPRLLIVANPRNRGATLLAKRLKPLASPTPNLIVVLGGDGTMLHAIRRHWTKRLPFLGLNRGHRGFLLNTVHRKPTAAFFRQPFIVRTLPLLRVEVTTPQGDKRQTFAVNDAYLLAEAGKTGWFSARVDGRHRTDDIVGDGLLVATAAGSTAYARAMGAEPMPIGAPRLILIGSNIAHPVTWRRARRVLQSSIVTFSNRDRSGWRKTYGFADGVSLGEATKIVVRVAHPTGVSLLLTPDHHLQTQRAIVRRRS